MSTSLHSLQFLTGTRSLYYGGLDDLPSVYPLERTVTPEQHVRFLKVLTLLADHIAVPPTFLAAGLPTLATAEHVKRNLQPLFEDRTLVTAVHSTMAEPVDFIEYKLSSASPRERDFLKTREAAVRGFFQTLPLLQRDIRTQSFGFRQLLFQNLASKFPEQAVRGHKPLTQLIRESESETGPILSREAFLTALSNLGWPPSSREFVAAFDSMNAAYYREGALTYSSEISDIHLRKYSGNSSDDDSPGRFLLAYDPEVFLEVLTDCGITTSDIEALLPEQIQKIRETAEFHKFVNWYATFARSVESTIDASLSTGGERMHVLRTGVAQALRHRLHTEDEKLGRLLLGEDLTSTAVLGVAGFALIPLLGLVAGFLPFLLRALNSSPGQISIRSAKPERFAMSLYLHIVTRKIWSWRNDKRSKWSLGPRLG